MGHQNLTQAQWRKPSRSNGAGNCVEVALNLPGVAAIRDSKLGDTGPVLSFTPAQFTEFIAAVKNGRFQN